LQKVAAVPPGLSADLEVETIQVIMQPRGASGYHGRKKNRLHRPLLLLY
jgi:hypothetical protein